MRTYDLMTIHNLDIGEEQIQGLVSEIEKFLTTHGAELSTTDQWGKRRLAYPIDHKKEGFYTVFTFTAETEVVEEVDRMLRLSDEVVRHKVVRTNDISEGA